MFDHICLNVTDFAKSKEFYSRALTPLGIQVMKEREGKAALGRNGVMLWIGNYGAKAVGVHIAFQAETREQVHAFYEAALAAGGKDNGKPGIREKYTPDYYAAFVLDPDGNNVEAVCRRKQVALPL